jgi:16S rRNA (uracil1498-N3)-methyltransferase
VAVAACEQCGRNQVPPVHEALSLADWLAAHDRPAQDGREPGTRLLLSLHPDARPLREAVPDSGAVWLLSGPEGGLAPAEEAAALAAGFVPVTLGPRVLRAETAPLAVLAALTLG